MSEKCGNSVNYTHGSGSLQEQLALSVLHNHGFRIADSETDTCGTDLLMLGGMGQPVPCAVLVFIYYKRSVTGRIYQ